MTFLLRLFCFSFAIMANIAKATTESTQTIKQLKYHIIAERSHKSNLFTQGLIVEKDFFYESSGLYGKSMLVSYPIAEPESTWAKLSAPFNQKKIIAERYFAEGLTLFKNKLYLLTWQEGTVFIYDAASLSQLNKLPYSGEGWGLTHNETQLIRSDGSANLFFHNAETFSIERTISVNLNKQPLSYLNELEYADGFIWANIWHDNRIIKINPNNGNVVGIIDLSDLTQTINSKDPESVLNGIAYDKNKKAFWITGKKWPKMFLIRVNE